MTGPDQPIYLASRSPRRAQLLDQAGISYHVISADVEEHRGDGEPAPDYVIRVARQRPKPRHNW